MADIHGIIAYPVTPFAADPAAGVDTARLAALVDRLVSAGVHGIAPLGSTGELAYLEEPEFDAVVDTTMATVDARLPVVVGVSDVTTAKTIRRARYAQQAGADAVMILPVSYWKLTEREIVGHYRSIGDAISIPIMATTTRPPVAWTCAPNCWSACSRPSRTSPWSRNPRVTCPACSASPNCPAAGFRSTTAATRWCSMP